MPLDNCLMSLPIPCNALADTAWAAKDKYIITINNKYLNIHFIPCNADFTHIPYWHKWSFIDGLNNHTPVLFFRASRQDLY